MSMSLRTHIKDVKGSAIGLFFRERFSHTDTLTKDVNRRLQNASTIRPAILLSPYVYSTLGTAIDYRIRYSFAITPNEQLTAWYGAWGLALKLPETTEDIMIPQDELLDLLSAHLISTTFDPFSNSVAYGPYSANLLESFFASLDLTLAEIKPSGRRLAAKQEKLLARYCYVLALFERVYREGLLSPAVLEGPLFGPTTKESVQELLAIPQDDLVDDLWEMSWVFYERCNHLLTKPTILNPHFVGSGDVGGADGDLIVDGCLIELKASVQPKIEPNWLRQLAGYLLLDYDDANQIRSLGIYMVRQGMLFTWPVEDFLQMLTGDPAASVASLRRELRARLQTAKQGR
jgi:hypothetical protein